MGSNMSTASKASRIAFWTIGIIALLWNAMGCINFMQQISPAGIATLPPEYQSYIETRPTYAFIAFGVSVIAGLIGAIFMLMRLSQATVLFLASGIGAFVATIPALNAGIPSIVLGSAMSIVLAASFALYASRTRD